MHFRKIAIAGSILCALSAPAFAQEATPLTITLSSYAFTPSTITLKSGTTYKLHLVDSVTKDHNFSAPEFFAASIIAPADQSKVKDGAVEVDDGGSVDVTVTPNKPGSYDLECSHFMHSSFGMTGKIIVQ